MRKRMLLAIVCVLLLVSTAVADPGDTLWTRTYGGTEYDLAYSVQQTSDGGYIIAGYTTSYGAGSGDFYLVKTDGFGNQEWAHTYGGTSDDRAFSVQQTFDGGYIIAGKTISFGAGGYDFYLVKTDGFGNELWTQTYGGTDSDRAYSVQQTSDGGYIIAGETYSFGAGGYDCYLVKTDGSGNQQWTQTFGGTSEDVAHSVERTSDGGYIIAGWTTSFGAGVSDCYLVKTDASGNELWAQTYGGTSHDQARSVQQTSDGGYVIAGSTDSFGAGGTDFYLVKTDGAGDTLWTQTYGGTSHDQARSVQQTSDGGYIIAGYTYSFGVGGDDFYLVKTDGSGNQQWEQTYGGTDGDRAYSVQQTSDGGYIIAGQTYSFGAGGYDCYLVKVSGDVVGVDGPEFESSLPAFASLSQSYPNPFNASTVIEYQLPQAGEVTLEVYNLIGEKVATLVNGAEEAGYKSVTWDASEVSSGLYFYRLTAGDFTETKRMMLVK